MREVVLTIRPLRLLPWIRRRLVFRVAETSDELLPQQFVALCAYTYGLTDDESFLRRYLGVDPSLLLMLGAWQQYELRDVLQQLPTLQLPATTFFVPTLPGGLESPQRRLAGMTFQQFMTVDEYYSWYHATSDGQWLDRFVAALYLRSDEDYHGRHGRHVPDLDARTAEVALLPQELKVAVMVNWMLVKEWLGKAYRDLFPPTETPSEPSSESRPRPAGWLRLFDAWVGDNVAFLDAYRTMECTDALRLINRKIKESRR